MGMPGVMGCAGALEKIPPGTVLVLDGTRGTVLLDPTPAEIADAQGREQRRRALAAQLEEVVAQPSVTADGGRIVLMGTWIFRTRSRPRRRIAPKGWGCCGPRSSSRGTARCPRRTSRRRTSDAWARHSRASRS